VNFAFGGPLLMEASQQMVPASDAVIMHKNEIQRSLNATHYDMTRANTELDSTYIDVADAIAQILKKFQDGIPPSPNTNG
jgi:hypothetical protein